MSGYPAFCATCHMTEHGERRCDAEALERRRRLTGLHEARERLRRCGETAIERNNYLRAARLMLASARVTLRMSALLAEEADAIMWRRR